MKKIQFLAVIALLVVLLMSPQNLSSSYDAPTIGIQSVDAADGDNWLTGYGFREKLNIFPITGAGTYYQLKLTVYHDVGDGVDGVGAVCTEGNAQTDFDDIRFTDATGDYELDYWLETFTASDTAIFWIEFEVDISSGLPKGYIYYGNVGVSTTSNGGETFFFYEDWSSESTAAWTQWSDDSGGSVTYSATDAQQGGQVLKLLSGAGNLNDEFRTTVETSAAYSLMFRAKLELTTSAYHAMRIGSGSPQEYAMSYIQSYSTSYYRLTVIDDNANADNQVMDSSHWGAYRTWEITRPRDGSDTKLYIDGVFDETGNMVTDATEISYATFGTTDSDKALYSDWFAARKFQVTEPYFTGPSAEEEYDEGTPSVDGGGLLNPETGPMLVPRETLYLGYANVSQSAGYENIAFVVFTLDVGADGVSIRYTLDGAVWVEQGTAENKLRFELVVGSCDASGAGTDLDVTFAFYVEWTMPDTVVAELWIYMEDDYAVTDDSKFGGYYEYESDTQLISNDFLDDRSGTSDRGDSDSIDSIIASGTVVFEGTSVTLSSGEVDVWILCPDVAGSAWSDLVLVDGFFNMTVDSDDVVGQDTYTIKVVAEGGGAGGTDLMYTTIVDYYIADKMNFTASVSSNWVLLDTTITVTVSGTYMYDDVSIPSLVWSNVDSGSVSYASAGERVWVINSHSDTHGLTKLINVSASCTWDIVTLSASAYSWMQYSEFAVWLFWNPSNFVWAVNSSAVQDGSIVQSYMNGTLDDYGVTSAGTCGDLIIGQFDTSWYIANVTITITIGGYEIIVFQEMLTVDILHSIHIETQQFYLTDNWVIINIQTNWNNATFFVWDNITGTPELIGASYEGSYPFARSSNIGLHNLIILVNGSHGTLVTTSQVAGTVDTDAWEYLQFPYTVNPIAFSITDPYVMQNNASIVFGAIFYTGDLTLDYTIYEDGIGLTSGILSIPSSGSYYLVKWTKSSITSVANWTIVLQSSTTNITIYGYNLLIQNSLYYYDSSGYFEGDTIVMGESVEVAQFRATESMWATVGTIMLIIALPVVAGIAVKTDRAKSKPRGKRSKANDGML